MIRGRILSEMIRIHWEVLNGVGVDGVGVIFPLFLLIFRFLTHFFAFFFSLFSSSPKGQGQTTAKSTAEKGNFTPTPSAPTPCKTSRIQARESELQAESRRYGPKVRVTAGQTPRIRTESPTKGPRMG